MSKTLCKLKELLKTAQEVLVVTDNLANPQAVALMDEEDLDNLQTHMEQYLELEEDTVMTTTTLSQFESTLITMVGTLEEIEDDKI